MRAVISLAAMVFAVMVAASAPAWAQSGTTPQTAEAIQAELDSLLAQISDLESKVNEMLAPSQQAEKQELRQQITVLQRQVRLKRMALQNLKRDDMALGQDSIRQRYRDQIRTIEDQKTIVRRETIAKFQKMLDEMGDSRMGPDIKFRLAQLYFEEAHEQFNIDMDNYDAAIDAGHDPGPPPTHDYSRSTGLYQDIIRDTPDFGGIDMCYYMLAYCLTEAGDDDGALDAYQTLITRRPDSQFVPESHVRMGEIYFDRGEMDRGAYDQAIYHYKQVDRNSKFYDKALYKLGWTYYKMANIQNMAPLDTAIDYFKQVLRYYESRPTQRLGGGDDLRKEAVDYIAISYADHGDDGLQLAQTFFQQSGNDEWNREVLRKMGDVYFGQDDYDNGRRASLLYLEKYPTDAKDPQIHMKIVDSYYKEGEWERAISESERMATLYAPDTPWAQANKGTRADRIEADKSRMSALYASATYHHEKAQNPNAGEEERAESYRKAIRSYETYTREYPDAKNFYDAMFNLAEAYYAVGDYVPAAGAYKAVAKDKEGKYYADARFDVVKSYESQIEREGGLPNKELRDKITASEGGGVEVGKGDEYKLQVMPLSPTAEKYVEALVDYAPEARSGKIPGDYIFEAGRVQFWYGHLDEASRLFQQVMNEYPNTKAADVSKFYSVEGAKLAGNLEEIGKILQANPSADPKQRAVEIEIAAAAGLMMASQLADEGKYSEALQAYQEAYENNPTAKDAPTALHNSAVLLAKKMNNLAAANTYLIKVAEEYPKYENAPDDLFAAANNYERLGDFDEAERTYERFNVLFPNNKDAQNALYNAVLLAINNQDFTQAEQMADTFATKYPGSHDAGLLFFQIAKMRESMGDDTGAESVYRQYTARFTDDPARLIEAYAKVGQRAMERGDSAEGQRNLNLAVGVYQRFGTAVPEAKKYAAMARFTLVQPLWDSYKAMVFTGDMKNDAVVLQQKAEAYKELKSAYEEVANYGDFEWFTAALHMTGMINREFSEALFKAPIPEGLTAEQEDEYVIKLEDIAFPIKAKAQEAFEKNVEKGNTERVHNKWIEASAAMLPFYKSKVQAEKFEESVFGSVPAFAGGDFLTDPQAVPAPAGGSK